MKRMWSRKELQQIASLMAIAQMQSGDVSDVKVFENIVDKDGHKRFIEGDLTLNTSLPSGVSKTYGKWALSGSHLLVVLCLSIAENTSISNGVRLVNEIELPQWVKDKIIPVWATNYIETKSVLCYADDWTTQSIVVNFVKSDDKIRLGVGGDITFIKDRNCRITFDVLIDDA